MTDDMNKSDAPEQESRRQASANFIVKQDDHSSIELRDAMDTAHRSLTESLQLSFRALQIVMLVLVVLCLVSGFRTVEDSQTGILNSDRFTPAYLSTSKLSRFTFEKKI